MARFLEYYNIVFRGHYVSQNDLMGENVLPDNAVMFREGDAMSDTFLPGFITELPLLLAMIVLTFQRYRSLSLRYRLNWKIVFVVVIVLVLNNLLSYLHEIIHGLCYPKEAKKSIWKDKKQGLMFIHCDAVVSKGQYFWIGISPTVFLGLLPFVIWYLAVPYIPMPWSLSLVFVAWFMVLGAMGDFCNIMHMVTQVPKGAKVMNYGLHSYWFFL